jgi:N4-gp56 family major capsid protein
LSVLTVPDRAERSHRTPRLALGFIPNPRRHDIRSALPAALQPMLQNGFLEQVFKDALFPELLFPKFADVDPWTAGLGSSRTSTRKGLLPVVTTPITGSDASVATYALEQWSVYMDQYGQGVQTDMMANLTALASKYAADVATLGLNAGQSINQLARNKLYTAYKGGRTWVTTTAGSGTSIAVHDLEGFGFKNVNGVPTAVSASNPLAVTIAGVANTVTGVSGTAGPGTLTVGTATAVTVGGAVVSTSAPVTIRPTGNSAFDLGAGNIATLSLFRAAVARLRKMNIPTVNGNYVAFIDPDTEAQLFADADFKVAATGAIESRVFRDMSLGTFLGIDWVRNNETVTITDGGTAASGVAGTLTVHRPIVMGAGALVSAPLEGQGQLLNGTGIQNIPNINMVNVAPGVDVVIIVKPPSDLLQQKLNTTWSWTGDFGVPSDANTGDSAVFKRAIMIEHA